MTTLFSLGHVVATPGALEALASMDGMVNMDTLIQRHANGDWGDLDDPEDKRLNEEAVKDGGDRIFSVYEFGLKTFWVITEADRSATTILLPDEY